MYSVGDRILTTNFAVVCLANLTFFISFVMFLPTLPIFIKELGGDPALIGTLVGGASIVSITLRPFVGRLVDSRGRKGFLTLGSALLLLSTVTYDFADTTALLWPARLIAGASISLFLAAGLAYVADMAPEAKRGQAMSIYGLSNNVAVALGPLFAMWIIRSDRLEGLNGRLLGWLPGQGSDAVPSFNFAVLFLAAGLVALVSLVLTRKLDEVFVPAPRGQETFGQMVTSVFSKAALFPAVLHMLVVVNFVALNIFVPLFGEELDIGNIGLYYTVMAGAIIASRVLAGPLLDRYPRYYSIVPAMGLMMVSTVLLGNIQEAWMVFTTGALVGLGAGVAQPGLQALLVDRAQGSNLGSASATFYIGLDAGLFAGGALMGVVLSLFDFNVMFTVAGSSSGLAAVLLAVVSTREARRSARGAEAEPAAAVEPGG